MMTYACFQTMLKCCRFIRKLLDINETPISKTRKNEEFT